MTAVNGILEPQGQRKDWMMPADDEMSVETANQIEELIRAGETLWRELTVTRQRVKELEEELAASRAEITLLRESRT